MNQLITSEIIDFKSIPAQAMTDMFSFGPLRAQSLELSKESATEVVPADVLEFLSRISGKTLKINFEAPFKGPKYVSFCTPENLTMFWFACLPLSSEKTNANNNLSDPNIDKSGYYAGKAVNLIHRSSGLFPEGLLLWFQDFQVFGYYNNYTSEVNVFPDTSWAEIEKKIELYLCAQGEKSPEGIKQTPLSTHFNPWDKWDYVEGN